MPPDDPAWPPGKNSLKRETALRLWGHLRFFDYLSACAHPSLCLDRVKLIIFSRLQFRSLQGLRTESSLSSPSVTR